jgi:predicted nucleotidyltransferase
MPNRYSDLQRICETFGVDILYVFGSRAGEVRAWMEGEVLTLPPGPSDVDVGVKPARGVRLSVYDKVRLAIALEDFFDVHRVDLRAYQRSNIVVE